MREKIFKIGEVAEMLALKSYVLRYWETEFPQLDPLRTEKGQRLYNDSHINLLRNIQDLLHVKGMTLEGARRELTAGYNMEITGTDISANAVASADVNNMTEHEMPSVQSTDNSDSEKNEYNAVNKDEINRICMELTAIRNILQGSP